MSAVRRCLLLVTSGKHPKSTTNRNAKVKLFSLENPWLNYAQVSLGRLFFDLAHRLRGCGKRADPRATRASRGWRVSQYQFGFPPTFCMDTLELRCAPTVDDFHLTADLRCAARRQRRRPPPCRQCESEHYLDWSLDAVGTDQRSEYSNRPAVERTSKSGVLGRPAPSQPSGLAFEDLPRIDVVLISHDHYDHLDLNTVKRLAAARDPLFLVPLGLKAWFAENGMTRVEEMDWWQEREYGAVNFVCVPAQHFSQRTLSDANERLWASWAVLSPERRLYFSGDTGYFAGFKEAGQRLGPFDVAALAIGAYLPPEIMKSVHLTPEEAVQAFIDLNARVLLGIHWGTFDLAEEPLDEPPNVY